MYLTNAEHKITRPTIHQVSITTTSRGKFLDVYHPDVALLEINHRSDILSSLTQIDLDPEELGKLSYPRPLVAVTQDYFHEVTLRLKGVSNDSEDKHTGLIYSLLMGQCDDPPNRIAPFFPDQFPRQYFYKNSFIPSNSGSPVIYFNYRKLPSLFAIIHGDGTGFFEFSKEKSKQFKERSFTLNHYRERSDHIEVDFYRVSMIPVKHLVPWIRRLMGTLRQGASVTKGLVKE